MWLLKPWSKCFSIFKTLWPQSSYYPYSPWENLPWKQIMLKEPKGRRKLLGVGKKMAMWKKKKKNFLMTEAIVLIKLAIRNSNWTLNSVLVTLLWFKTTRVFFGNHFKVNESLPQRWTLFSTTMKIFLDNLLSLMHPCVFHNSFALMESLFRFGNQNTVCLGLNTDDHRIIASLVDSLSLKRFWYPGKHMIKLKRKECIYILVFYGVAYNYSCWEVPQWGDRNTSGIIQSESKTSEMEEPLILVQERRCDISGQWGKFLFTASLFHSGPP